MKFFYYQYSVWTQKKVALWFQIHGSFFLIFLVSVLLKFMLSKGSTSRFSETWINTLLSAVKNRWSALIDNGSDEKQNIWCYNTMTHSRGL